MGDKYYIPGLPELKKNLEKDCKELIVPDSNNLIKLEKEEDRKKLIDSIKNIQYINDQDLHAFYEEHMPEVAELVKRVPIDTNELKDALRHIFNDIPDEYFEGRNILQCLSATFNYVIRKNEIEFLVINIAELKYDESYKYNKFQEFYFEMMKFNFNLEPYWIFFSNTQALLQRLFLKEVLFSDSKITDEKQKLLNRIFNLNGKALSDFDFKLNNVKNQIKSNKITLKRTKIPLPKKYNEYEKKALENIDKVQSEIKGEIEKNKEAKKQLQEEIEKRHGWISKTTAKKLLRMLPHLGKIFKS